MILYFIPKWILLPLHRLLIIQKLIYYKPFLVICQYSAVLLTLNWARRSQYPININFLLVSLYIWIKYHDKASGQIYYFFGYNQGRHGNNTMPYNYNKKSSIYLDSLSLRLLHGSPSKDSVQLTWLMSLYFSI